MPCASGPPVGTYRHSDLQHLRVPCSPKPRSSLGCKTYKCAIFLLWRGLPPAFIHCTVGNAFSSLVKELPGKCTSSNGGSLKFEKYYFTLKRERSAVIEEPSRRERLERKGMAMVTGGIGQGRTPTARKMGKETRPDFPLRAHDSYCFAPHLCPVTKTKWWHGLSIHIAWPSFYTAKKSEILVSICKRRQAVSWHLDTIFLWWSKWLLLRSQQM